MKSAFQKSILEIACFSVNGAIIAQQAGADRLELCENPFEGGTTPSYGTLLVIKEKINIPVFPIIRPRGGDFLYSDDEFEMIRHDIKLCKDIGFEGIVTGLLQANGSIDINRTKELVSLAYPMEVTFHRAFDRCKEPLQSMEQIIECGCQRILTSGQFPTAIEGADLIAQLIEQADDRIVIIPASGINSLNISELAGKTKAVEFHASARIEAKSEMQFESASMKEKLTCMTVNGEEVKRMIEKLQSV